MKKHSKAERLEHVENWRKGGLSKAAYAKSEGLIPTTFYTWARGLDVQKQTFVEIPRGKVFAREKGIVIETGKITISLPLCADIKELQKVFSVLGGMK